MPTTNLNVGVIGLGRLGRIYARDLATRIPRTRLVAVADLNEAAVNDVRDAFGVPHATTDPDALINDPAVDAVVIVSPTSTHGELTRAVARAGKPIFCEKPPATRLNEAIAMQRVVEDAGVFFQLGFMRRFDPGYAAAKAQLAQGAIGDAVVFKSTSRDQSRPSVEYANPKTSGGLIIDMGIHDFDLARWFMGEVESVHAVGGVLCYPELGEVGDIDNAIVTLRFTSGRLGVVDLTRNGIYGYDVSTELLGTKGTMRIGYQQKTPVLVMTAGAISHDTVSSFEERFRDAYTIQLADFADNVLDDRPPPVTVVDGLEALRLALAATRARESGQPVDVASVVADA